MEEYSYKDLCIMFNEESKKSNARDKQFKRWRKEYDIEKIPHKNKYTVKPRTLDVAKPSAKRADLKKIIEPMICDLFIKEGKSFLGLTQLEIHEKLGLINHNFSKLTYTKEAKQLYADSLKIPIEDVDNYRDEVYNLNKITINSIIKDMEKKGILAKNSCYKMIDENDNVTFSDKHMTSEIMRARNDLARKIAGEELYTDIKDKHLREKVLKEVNKQVGLKSHYQAFMLILDIESIEYYLQAKYSYYNTYEASKIESNDGNRNKIMKSTRGELKNIPYDNKKKLTTSLIALGKKKSS
jgi:hypothetical protein